MSNGNHLRWARDKQLLKVAIGSGILVTIICIVASFSGGQASLHAKPVRHTGKWSTASGCIVPVRQAIEASAAFSTLDGWHGIRSTIAKRSARARRSARVVPSITPLLAIPTANVWQKTELLLNSLAVVPDRFELLVVDEHSRDGTPEHLAKRGVRVVSPPGSLGVTYNWNLIYQEWLKTEHEALFIGNNDILIPAGVLNALTHALTAEGGNCDLVCPLSTIAGKGWWGPVTGLEALFDLTSMAAKFANSSLNYQHIQDVLDEHGCNAVLSTRNVHKKPGFSGFFFGVRRSITKWAFDGDNLFDPSNRILGQEHDLWLRMVRDKGSRICLHTGTFVYHFKGSTIPYPQNGNDSRESFDAATMQLTGS